MQSHRRRQSPFPVAATLSSRAAGQAFGSILLLLSVILAFDTARAQNARAEGASTTILTDGNAVVTGFSGVSGGVSIETLLMKRRPLRENHSASFDMRSEEKISEAVAPQPVSTGASRSNASTDFR